MELLGPSVTTTLVGLAAVLLALSVLVQVVQELWKHLTSSRSRNYSNALEDFLGPLAGELRRPGMLPEFLARGPFQLLRLSPRGNLLPLSKNDLIRGLERTTAPWVRRGLDALRAEAESQHGTPGPTSPLWMRFLTELQDADPGGPGTQDLDSLRAWVVEYGVDTAQVIDAGKALTAFRHEFMPHVEDAETGFGRLDQIVEHNYRRRNLRQTFVLGVLVAFAANQPVQRIYDDAQRLSPEQAMAMAQSAVSVYEAHVALDSVRAVAPGGRLTPAQLDSALTRSLDVVVQRGDSTKTLNGWTAVRQAGWGGFTAYLVGCIVTAVLISFGAPFWNDMLGALGRSGRGAGTASAGSGTGNGGGSDGQG